MTEMCVHGHNIVYHFRFFADADGVMRAHNAFLAGTTQFGTRLVREVLWPEEYTNETELSANEATILHSRATAVNNLLRNNCYANAVSTYRDSPEEIAVPSWLEAENKSEAKEKLKEHM